MNQSERRPDQFQYLVFLFYTPRIKKKLLMFSEYAYPSFALLLV